MTDQTSSESWSSGARYEPYVGRWSRLVASSFIDWLDVAENAAWLDLGCGTGALSQVVLDRARPGTVVGLDPSAGFVQFARENTVDVRARFEVGDAQQLGAVGGSFDAVVSALMLNFVPDRARALAEMRRVARPDGVVAAYVWDYPGEMQLITQFWNAAVELNPDAAELHEGRRFAFCQPDQLENMFSAAGLTRVQSRSIVIPTIFRDFDDYWTPFLGGQGPAPSYAMSLNENRRVELREVLRSRLTAADDGTITLTARAWAIRGYP
ncbi:MAG: class I SAM-dependent methyltransferase [Actinomycetota bacterium]